MIWKALIIASILGASSGSLSGVSQDEISYGLSFQSHGVIPDERTSMCLNPDVNVNGKEGFTVEFDLNILFGWSFGYVFRFVDDNLNHIDLASNHDASKVNFLFGDSNGIISNNEIPLQGRNLWHHVKVSVQPRQNEILFEIDSSKTVTSLAWRHLGKFKLYFGKVDNKRYFSTDLPNFTIRNVRLYDKNGRLTGSWPLSRHAVKQAYDTLSHRKLVVTNGLWEIDSHVNWKQVRTFDISDNTPQIANSPDGNQLFIAWEHELFVYQIDENVLYVKDSTAGSPFIANGSHMVYDKKANVLISYYPADSKKNIYHFDTNKWDYDGYDGKLLAHHGRWYDIEQQKLYTFGGYGMHLFSNYWYETTFYGGWTRTELPITPRYLCAMGRFNDKILVVGGFGSKSGKQEEDSKNAYDIWSVDPVTHECRKVCDIQRDSDEDPFVFGEQFISDERQGCIYALKFNNEKFNSSVSLVRIDLKTGKQENFADSLPFKFIDIRSYCSLFYNNVDKKAYAVLSEVNGDFGSKIKLYSISYPPLHTSDVLVEQHTWRYLVLWGVGILVLAALSVFSLLRFHRKEDTSVSLQLTPTAKELPNSFIGFLGGFKVIDRKGEDISKQFSPIMREILSYIVIKSVTTGKDVSLQKLDEEFWYGMERKNVLNNRRVNFSKLRALLLLVGKVDIVTNGGQIRLVWDDNVFCDYKVLCEMIDSQKAGKGSLEELISLAALGPLLPEMNSSWLESYRSDLTYNLSSLLESHPSSRKEKELLESLHLAEVVLLNDNIEENAVAVKCKCLYLLNRKSKAKAVYDNFTTAYQKMFDALPDKSFKDMIS